jgi:uncharacterized lipoprotein
VKRHFLVRWSLPTFLVATALLSGCSWFHHDKVEYYKGAAETRPLEVPPDLDAPATNHALVVPGSTPAAAAPAAHAPVTPAPAAAAAASTAPATPSAMPPAAAVAADATELHVADTVDSTWQRVGLALERAQLGKITSKDDAARSYAFEFNGPVDAAPAPEHHWYTPVLHPFGGDKPKASVVTSALRVNVSEDAGGARVSVVGNPNDASAAAATHRLIAVLRERLS